MTGSSKVLFALNSAYCLPCTNLCFDGLFEGCWSVLSEFCSASHLVDKASYCLGFSLDNLPTSMRRRLKFWKLSRYVVLFALNCLP